MKIRTSFVTNSSSSSFICVLAKVEDKEKAQVIIDKYNLDVYSGKDIKEGNSDVRDVDWAGVWFNHKKLDDAATYVYYEDCTDIQEDEWGDTDYDFNEDNHSADELEAIDAVTKENGFTDVDVQCGAGRDG